MITKSASLVASVSRFSALSFLICISDSSSLLALMAFFRSRMSNSWKHNFEFKDQIYYLGTQKLKINLTISSHLRREIWTFWSEIQNSLCFKLRKHLTDKSLRHLFFRQKKSWSTPKFDCLERDALNKDIFFKDQNLGIIK